MIIDQFKRGKRSQTRVKSNKAGGRHGRTQAMLTRTETAMTILRYNDNEVSRESLAPNSI